MFDEVAFKADQQALFDKYQHPFSITYSVVPPVPVTTDVTLNFPETPPVV